MDDEDDEAEYQYYRQRDLVRPHWPILEQNITDTRGSHLGRAPFSSTGIGGSADASFEFAPSTHVQLEFAQAHFAQEFRFGAQEPSAPALNAL